MVGPVVDNRWRLLPPPERPPDVSVIVTHYEQQADLDRVLAMVAEQRGPVRIVDVVVADDGSWPPPSIPPDVAGAPATLVTQPDLGIRPAAARNAGVAHSGGSVLVFLDADTVPGPHTVARLAALPAVVPDAVTVGRRHHCELDDCSPREVVRRLRAGSGGPAFSAHDDPAWLRRLYARTDDLARPDDRSYQGIISAVMATSRRFFDELGGFDATIVGYGGEDWELAYRAYCAGGVLAHIADADVYHNGPDWAERTGGAPKNGERLALFDRIPGADDGVIGVYGQHLVTIDASEWREDQLLAVTSSILRAHPTAIRVAITGHDRPPLARLRADCRILTTDHPADARRRSLSQTVIGRPVDLGDAGLGPLLDRLGPGRAGRVTVVADGADVAVASSTRAMARAGRWAAGGCVDDLIDRLFGSTVVAAPGLGWTALPPTPDLAARLVR